MSGPRDKQAYLRGRAYREQIRAAMLEHAQRHPLARPLTWEQIQVVVPTLKRATIYWRVAAIRREQRLSELDKI
jgi:hypothetical protein